MMAVSSKFSFRPSSGTNGVTILVFGAVLLVLGFCGILYWRYVEAQTLHLQERNFRSLTVIGQSLTRMVASYGTLFKTVIEGEPPCHVSPCPEENRRKAYHEALLALQAFEDVKITKETREEDGFAVEFVKQHGISSIKLTHVHQDRAKPIQTRWKIQAVIDIGTVMRQLVTEDLFADVLLADHKGKVLYHQPSRGDPSGFEFVDVSYLLHRLNDSESKGGGAEKDGAGRKEGLVSTLPLLNEAPIGGMPHAIFAQATDLLADRETAQTLILVGIVPAGQFHAQARAIPLNQLLLAAGFLLGIFFVLPYVKLRTNGPAERLTPMSVAGLVISTFLGTAVLTFGLADLATYHNLRQQLNARLEFVSDEIRNRFNDDVRRALAQLALFDHSCKGECSDNLGRSGQSHLAQRLCIRMDGGENKREFFFSQTGLDTCLDDQDGNSDTKVVFPDVNTMFWVGSTGELKVLRSREPDPWKYANLKERQYVRRILADETFRRDQQEFWIQPIYSWTTGNNSAVFSIESRARQSSPEGDSDLPIVAALEVKLPSVTGAGVPPGMGFAVINQEGEVLFHSDERRNLRENFFEESDRDGRLRQAVFARATTQYDGRYWGKDRHFHITPLFPAKILEPGVRQKSGPIVEPPDVHWSLVTYWDTDMLRDVNVRALYSSGTLFFIYAVLALSIGVSGWWIYSRVSQAAYQWVWPRREHRHQLTLGLLVVALGAVGVWYLRPHSYPDMLLWGLLPALVAAAAVWSIVQADADPIGHDKTDRSARRRYRRSYALLVAAGLLTVVVIPALVIFRVSVDVEWRLLAKFALFDLDGERKFQVQKVRESYPSRLFHEADHNGEVRTEFIREFAGLKNVYAEFPFPSCRQEDRNCREAPTNVVERGDDRLIRWLYHIIERPRIGHGGDETDMFLEAPEQWLESEWGTLGFNDRPEGTVSPISLHSIPSAIPQWLYSLVVFGGLVPLAVLRVQKLYVSAAVTCVLGGALWFGLVGEALAVLGVSALLYGAWYVLPTFATQRVLLLDFPYSSMDATAGDKGQEIAGMVEDPKPPDGWPPGLRDVFIAEMSGLRNALRLTGILWSEELTKTRETIVQLDIQDDLDVTKEQLIRELLEKATNQYLRIWKQCTESQRRSLFNLARDGFLHSRNPDIGPLLKSGLIVANLKPRPMNESFRRFIIRTGLEEGLDEDIAQARPSTWVQVWRPIGVGLVLTMVFLVLTQEQYRAITLAFLGVLPGLLGALSQALTSPKKEKIESASAA